ncbi:oligosaccharide flippase family protein [Malaciobacter mytili]|nr:lipopolysaccharide biosynthesis protein [Malaciobacter mytili]
MGLSALLSIVKLTLFSSILGPEEYGLYSLVLSTYIFIVYLGGLGLNEAIIKLGSKAYGKQEFKYILKLRDISIFYSILLAVFFSIVFFIVINFIQIDNKVYNSLLLSIFLAISALEFNLMDAFLRVQHRFVSYSLMLFSKSFLVVLTGYFIAPIYKANGVIWVEIVSFFIIFIVVLFYNKNERFCFSHLKNSLDFVTDAIKNGIAILSSNIIRNLTLNIDKWAITSSLGLVSLGKYSFSMIIYMMAIFSLGLITTVLGPKWLSEFSSFNNSKILLDKINKVIILVVISGILVFLLFIFYLQSFLNTFYPDYSDITIYKTILIIFLGLLFQIPVFLYDWFFIAVSNEKFVLKMTFNMFMITFIMILLCWYFKTSIIYFALVFTIVRIYILTHYLVYIYKKFAVKDYN